MQTTKGQQQRSSPGKAILVVMATELVLMLGSVVSCQAMLERNGPVSDLAVGP